MDIGSSVVLRDTAGDDEPVRGQVVDPRAVQPSPGTGCPGEDEDAVLVRWSPTYVRWEYTEDLVEETPMGTDSQYRPTPRRAAADLALTPEWAWLVQRMQDEPTATAEHVLTSELTWDGVWPDGR